MIDQTGNPLLADFGLLTIVSDPSNFISSSSCAQGGTVRWMGPECIAPQEFGLKDSRPTKSSDCYSLGMVIYETISGSPPFHECTDVTVFFKVLKGEHPSRGVEFTDGLWEILERCWVFQPNDRPRIEDVLQHLESVSNGLGLPPSENRLTPKEGDLQDSPSIFTPKRSARETTPPQPPTCDSASIPLTPTHPRPSGPTSQPPQSFKHPFTSTSITQPTSQSTNDQPSKPGVKRSAEDAFSPTAPPFPSVKAPRRNTLALPTNSRGPTLPSPPSAGDPGVRSGPPLDSLPFSEIAAFLGSLVENGSTRNTEASDRKWASSSGQRLHPGVPSAGWTPQDTERTYTTPQVK